MNWCCVRDVLKIMMDIENDGFDMMYEVMLPFSTR